MQLLADGLQKNSNVKMEVDEYNVCVSIDPPPSFSTGSTSLELYSSELSVEEVVKYVEDVSLFLSYTF